MTRSHSLKYKMGNKRKGIYCMTPLLWSSRKAKQRHSDKNLNSDYWGVRLLIWKEHREQAILHFYIGGSENITYNIKCHRDVH